MTPSEYEKNKQILYRALGTAMLVYGTNHPTTSRITEAVRQELEQLTNPSQEAA